MRHYNVCSKMMEKGRKMWDVTCFFPSPSFYYIHCSDAWNAFQTHTFRSRQPLTTKKVEHWIDISPSSKIIYPNQVASHWPLKNGPTGFFNLGKAKEFSKWKLPKLLKRVKNFFRFTDILLNVDSTCIKHCPIFLISHRAHDTPNTHFSMFFFSKLGEKKNV